MSDPQQPIPQPDPIPQPAPEPFPRARTACAPIRLQPKRPRGTLLLESNSAARLGPAEQRWHAAPARQLSSFAHLPPGSARYNGKCVDGIPFPTGMTCCKTGIRPRGGCVATTDPFPSWVQPTVTSALHAIVAGGSHGP